MTTRAESSPPVPALTRTRPAAPPASRTPAPARERLDCRFEPWSLVYREVWGLAKRHYAEGGTASGEAPLDPDWDRLFEYERGGFLKVWTVRHAGVMVGFALSVVTHDLFRASTRYGYIQLFWLAPEWRDGLRGVRFLRAMVEAVEGLGVSVVRVPLNDLFEPGADGRTRVAVLFERQGFRAVETVMEKVIHHGRQSEPSE